MFIELASQNQSIQIHKLTVTQQNKHSHSKAPTHKTQTYLQKQTKRLKMPSDDFKDEIKAWPLEATQEWLRFGK